MTAAICFACGGFKVGAWAVCPACGAKPKTDDDLVFSLALTDHYLPPEGLEHLWQQAMAGQPSDIDEPLCELLLQGIREERQRKPW